MLYLPLAGSRAPTTRILKVSPVDDTQVTRNVVALPKIADACATRIAPSKALSSDIAGRHINAILSTRFDREIQIIDGSCQITHVHAQDFCQALGLLPTLKHQRASLNKAHRYWAGAVAVIRSMASVPTIFQRDFLEHTLFNALVGNSDNHGKNGSMLHRNGSTTLAPLYDVVPLFMDRKFTHPRAFRHGKVEFTEDVTPDNLHGLLSDLGFGTPQIRRIMKQTATLAKRIAETAAHLAPKELADSLHAHARVGEAALGTGFGLPPRDNDDRSGQNDRQVSAGGWGGFS